FLAVIKGADKDRAAAVAERIRADLAGQPLTSPIDRQPVALTLSAAVAGFPDDARTPEDLLEAASRALYVSKHAGKDRVSIAGRVDDSIAAQRDAFANLPCPAF